MVVHLAESPAIEEWPAWQVEMQAIAATLEVPLRIRFIGAKPSVIVAILLLGVLVWHGGCPVRRAGPTTLSPGSSALPTGLAEIGASGLRPLGVNAHGCMEFENVKDGTILVQIPGGSFQMGGDGREWEKPIHSETVPSFFMARVPVTNAQFRRFVTATGHLTEGDRQEFASQWGEQVPVVCVNWNDAQAYCAWAGLRLPSETEWEYAARGSQSLVYPWGNVWEDHRCHSSVGGRLESAGRPAPVGSYPLGASPFGCLDMAGNVWQWTSSWLEAYPGSSFSCNVYGHQYRVKRGGAWTNNESMTFRAACRTGGRLSCRVSGFRCARDLP